MKKEPRLLYARAVDSLILAIHNFNAPWERGRKEVVLILLDRAFELLLKAIILHKGGRIREPSSKETIGFDKCVRKCVSEADVRCLTEEQALTVQIINSLRDAAQHYFVELSEQQLYMYTQAGVTLFGHLVKQVIGDELGNHLPERVLPVSTSPPKDLHVLVSSEFKEIKGLVRPRSRRKLDARAKVRPLAIVEASLNGERMQPSDAELDRILKRVQAGVSWQEIFPGVASLTLETEGTGLSVSIRLTKKEGDAVQIVPEGTPGATVVAVRRVDELSFYNLGLKDLATHLKMSQPRTLALVQYLDVQSDAKYFKDVTVGKMSFKRYSQEALKRLRDGLAEVDMDEVWDKHKPTGKPKKHTKRRR